MLESPRLVLGPLLFPLFLGDNIHDWRPQIYFSNPNFQPNLDWCIWLPTWHLFHVPQSSQVEYVQNGTTGCLIPPHRAPLYRSQHPGISLGSSSPFSSHLIYQPILSFLPLKIFQTLSLLSPLTTTVARDPPSSVSLLAPSNLTPHTVARVIFLTHKSDHGTVLPKTLWWFPNVQEWNPGPLSHLLGLSIPAQLTGYCS